MVNWRNIIMELLLQWFLLSSFETDLLIYPCRKIVKFVSYSFFTFLEKVVSFTSAMFFPRIKKYFGRDLPLSIVCFLSFLFLFLFTLKRVVSQAKESSFFFFRGKKCPGKRNTWEGSAPWVSFVGSTSLRKLNCINLPFSFIAICWYDS